MQTIIKGVKDSNDNTWMVKMDHYINEDNWSDAVKVTAYIIFLVAVGVLFLAVMGV